jgi:signal transduction histidine kinase
MSAAALTAHTDIDALHAELRKLRRINTVLMDRVERDMNAAGGNAFSLFQAAITLEGRVSERTAELTHLTHRLMQEISVRRETERALLRAKAEAEQANLGKTRFLAAASHDLHQPLNAARLFLGALADEVGAGRAWDLAGRVESALDAVAELIDALMDISKLDAGAWVTAPTSFPLAPLLLRLADEFGPQAAAWGLSLRVVPSSAVIYTDRALFGRILNNLVSNALRYTETGRVLIGCRRQGQQVSVEVWDTGVGIPDALQATIFEEFRQLGSPPRRSEKGSGLGLAIVDRIARLLGVPITLTSRVGHGSCFAVRVARGNADDVAATFMALPAAALGREFAGLCVVCLENDLAALEGLASLLTAWGCRPVSATGLDRLPFDLERADLIIADYHLDNGQLGTEAVEVLRERLRSPVPAVIISSDRAYQPRESAEAIGCGFLAKPVQPAKLRAVVGYVLGQVR